MDHASVAPRSIAYHLLEEMTNGFSKGRELGSGTYGTVYLGLHKDGEKIAVKMLRTVLGLDDAQFEKEYHNLESLRHQNIVQLVGYCNETRRKYMPHEGKIVLAEQTHRALCFEYMQNGSLDTCLSDESGGQDWHTRYAIIKGICKGLKYLHEELEHPMFHLDLKPANILLDGNNVPKIADFGLSRFIGEEETQITKNLIGTIGYLPPEFINQGVISSKLDIFSLGIIIIKIMTGPTGYTQSVEMSSQEFIDHVHGKWRNRLHATFSACVLESYCKQVKRCIEIALRCVEIDRRERPTVGDILNELNETEMITSPYLPRTFVDEGSRPAHLASLPNGQRCQSMSKAENLFGEVVDDNKVDPMTQKWGRVLGAAARKEWEAELTARATAATLPRPTRRWSWEGSLACAWPFSRIERRSLKGDVAATTAHSAPVPPADTVAAWYRALECGELWFPAQVYNREEGHVAFLLSCYDAHLRYDRRTDTFTARYPLFSASGRKQRHWFQLNEIGEKVLFFKKKKKTPPPFLAKEEDGVQWCRIRAAPVSTPAQDLHVSGCLEDLHPGDHFEVQWRLSKDVPYGWWYGMVGHLESCNANEHLCRCHEEETIMLEFKHYASGSWWRQATVSRKDHTEKGDETRGFYGGIRKLETKDEISTWHRFWPVDVLD